MTPQAASTESAATPSVAPALRVAPALYTKAAVAPMTNGVATNRVVP